MADTLNEMADRLQKAREKTSDPFEGQGKGAMSAADSRGLGLGLRITIEFVSAVAVGFGLGYGLDLLFETSPWLAVVFLIVGCIAGFMQVIRTAQEHDRKRQAARGAAASQPQTGAQSEEESRG